MRRADGFTRVILGVAAAIPLLAMAYAVLSGRVTDGPSGVYYVVVPGICGLLVLAAQWLSATSRVNVVLALMATGMSLLAVEGFIGLREAKLASCEGIDEARRNQCRFALSRGLPFDARSTIAVIRELEAAHPGTPVVPRLNASLKERLIGDSIAPLGGISAALTVLCAEAGVFHTFTSDSYGFRNPSELDSTGPAIVLVGDSFTEGRCVGEDATIGARLRAFGNPVLTLGLAGNGPLSELATLKEYVSLVSPSLVVWLYYEGNDLLDLEDEKRNPLLVRYLTEGAYQDLRHRQPLVDSVLGLLAMEMRATAELEAEARARSTSTASALLGFVLFQRVRELIVGALRAPEEPAFTGDVESFRAVLAAAQAVSEELGVDLLFVYLPEYARYAGSQPPDPDWRERRAVLDAVRGLGIPTIDVDSVFRADDPLAAFTNRLPGHYGSEGYRRVAEAIHAFIADSSP